MPAPTERKSLGALFKQVNPRAYAAVQGNPAAVRTLAKIETRANAIKKKTIAHHKHFEDRWVAKETIAIWQRHLASNAKNPAPPGVEQKVAPAGVMRLANQVVQARTTARLSRINEVKTRMQNAVVRNFRQSMMPAFNQAASPEQKNQQTRKFRRTQ